MVSGIIVTFEVKWCIVLVAAWSYYWCVLFLQYAMILIKFFVSGNFLCQCDVSVVKIYLVIQIPCMVSNI